MEYNISYQRKYEIERDLEKFKENESSNFFETFNGYSKEEYDYLKIALLLPIEDISLQLTLYESMDSKVGKDILCNRLSCLFNAPKNIIEKRILDVGKISEIKNKEYGSSKKCGKISL